jgi:hypothetical protein
MQRTYILIHLCRGGRRCSGLRAEEVIDSYRGAFRTRARRGAEEVVERARDGVRRRSSTTVIDATSTRARRDGYGVEGR